MDEYLGEVLGLSDAERAALARLYQRVLRELACATEQPPDLTTPDAALGAHLGLRLAQTKMLKRDARAHDLHTDRRGAGHP